LAHDKQLLSSVPPWHKIIEAIVKIRIASEGKAQGGEKMQHTQ